MDQIDSPNPYKIVDICLPPQFTLKDYLILRVLGQGGFGITYQAQDLRSGEFVVIKEHFPTDFAARVQNGHTVIPKPRVETSLYKNILKAFLTEAQTLSRFRHPNIVQILDYFEAQGTAYFVMPFIIGQTLEDLLAQKPQGKMGWREVYAWLPQILNALAVIHKEGFLHRDLKPENIFFSSNNEPLLIDFGSARNALVARSQSMSVFVTPGYSPVEQHSTWAKAQGPWTDIYALGAVLFNVLTGQKPAQAMDRQNALMENEPDPMIKRLDLLTRENVDEAMLEAIKGSLKLYRKDRIQGVAEFVNILTSHSQDPALFPNINLEPPQVAALKPSAKPKAQPSLEKKTTPPASPPQTPNPPVLEPVSRAKTLALSEVEPFAPKTKEKRVFRFPFKLKSTALIKKIKNLQLTQKTEQTSQETIYLPLYINLSENSKPILDGSLLFIFFGLSFLTIVEGIFIWFLSDPLHNLSNKLLEYGLNLKRFIVFVFIHYIISIITLFTIFKLNKKMILAINFKFFYELSVFTIFIALINDKIDVSGINNIILCIIFFILISFSLVIYCHTSKRVAYTIGDYKLDRNIQYNYIYYERRILWYISQIILYLLITFFIFLLFIV
ncbi:MAG: protein kinase [Deltaproteobacteria bacterium]|jgi:serine/threonine protein kinase|nr:protein kinase [Deltaproteobacteria bacterium]